MQVVETPRLLARYQVVSGTGYMKLGQMEMLQRAGLLVYNNNQNPLALWLLGRFP